MADASSTSPLNSVGNLVACGAVTRTLKDWEGASDLYKRKLSLNRVRQRRLARGLFAASAFMSLDDTSPSPSSPKSTLSKSSSTGALQGVLTRGPMKFELEGNAEASFKEKLEPSAIAIFKELDPGSIGLVSVDSLYTSFNKLHDTAPRLTMGRVMFDRYVEEFLPPQTEGITLEQFIDFHRLIWQNQPLGVRRSRNGVNITVNELQSAESLARKAFEKYKSKDRYGGLHKQELPSIITDLGLDLGKQDPDSVDRFYEREFTRRNRNTGLSFQDFVKFTNQYIDTLEVSEGVRADPRLPRSASAASLV